MRLNQWLFDRDPRRQIGSPWLSRPRSSQQGTSSTRILMLFFSFFLFFVIIVNIEFSKAWRGSALCPWHCPSHHRDPCPLDLGCPRGALKVSQLAGLRRSLFSHGGRWQKIFVFRIQVSESRRLDNSIPTGLLRMLLMGIRFPSLKAGPSSSTRQILPSSNIIIIKLFYNVIQTVLGQEQ